MIATCIVDRNFVGCSVRETSLFALASPSFAIFCSFVSFMEIIAISAKKEKEFQNKFIGETFDVLFEKEVSKNVYLGHTMNYLPVYLKSEENLEGKIKGVFISDGEIFTHKNADR